MAPWHEPIRQRWDALAARYPRWQWARRWGVSAASLVSGLATLLVFRRGIEYFPWFVGYLLLVWLVGVVLAERRRALLEAGRRMVGRVVDYTVQSLLHGLILFLLPIYYASTTLWSPNVWFLLLLAAAAILTTMDPWYRATILRYRWGEILLFSFGLFASLNVAFPLLAVPSAWALPLSAIASMLALIPALHRALEVSWRGSLLFAGICAAFGAILLIPLRQWIPPVPLHLTRATFAKSVTRLEPDQPVSSISTEELRVWGGITSFTAVAAPAGLREPILHLWRKDGAIVAKIPLSPISGGRPGGFRTYSRKTDLGTHPAGSWSVDVVTAHHQLIGRARLVVTP